jgi:cell division protein FtsB
MLFVACVVLTDSLFGDRGLAARIRAQRDYLQLEQELRQLRQENAGAREHIRRLQSDPAAIKAVAREELGMIRKGETLIVLRNP